MFPEWPAAIIISIHNYSRSKAVRYYKGGGQTGHHSHFFLPGPLGLKAKLVSLHGDQHLIIVFFYRRRRTLTACFECTAVQFMHETLILICKACSSHNYITKADRLYIRYYNEIHCVGVYFTPNVVCWPCPNTHICCAH